MRIVYCKHFPPKGYKAITLLNVIFVRRDCSFSDTDYRHENIHWAQEKELWIIGFYLLYVLDFLRLLLKYQRWHKAYRNICFEREAYLFEDDIDYLTERERFAWKKYKA